MGQCIEREDILAIYALAGLTAEEEEQVIKQADEAFKYMPQYKKQDIKKILKDVPRDQNGYMSFHDMQMCVAFMLVTIYVLNA